MTERFLGGMQEQFMSIGEVVSCTNLLTCWMVYYSVVLIRKCKGGYIRIWQLCFLIMCIALGYWGRGFI